MNSTPATSSITGSVLGRHTIDVTPPAAAARLPVSIVSLCSSPGSRSCTRMSIRPGASTRPWQSWTSASSETLARVTCDPIAEMSPFSTSTPPVSSRLLAGSTMRALMSASGRSCFLGGLGGRGEGVRLGQRQLGVVEAEEAEIFAGRGHVGALHALELQAQHHHDVDVLQPLL